MDIQEPAKQAISDDQELAKVLAGVSQQTDEPDIDTALNDLSAPVVPVPPAPAASIFPPALAALSDGTSLDSIKQDALNELRPLVDKLDVSPEEKFDTYLLLLRSTDDTSLIAPAHESARSIVDEARRAQALLDIIKEIDYLSAGQQAPTV